MRVPKFNTPSAKPPKERPNNQRPNNQRPDNQRPNNQRPDNQRPDNQRPDNQRPQNERPQDEPIQEKPYGFQDHGPVQSPNRRRPFDPEGDIGEGHMKMRITIDAPETGGGAGIRKLLAMLEKMLGKSEDTGEGEQQEAPKGKKSGGLGGLMQSVLDFFSKFLGKSGGPTGEHRQAPLARREAPLEKTTIGEELPRGENEGENAPGGEVQPRLATAPARPQQSVHIEIEATA